MRLGWNLRLFAPLEYDMIMQVAGIFGIPHPDLIETISYTSLNPFFRTQEFRKMLIQYREVGCYASDPKPPPNPRQIRYAQARLRTMKEKFAKGKLT